MYVEGVTLAECVRKLGSTTITREAIVLIALDLFGSFALLV